MNYFVPIYCIITALTVVLNVMHTDLIHAFFATGCALLAVGAGDELRSIFKFGTPLQKISRAILAILMLFIAIWMGRRCGIYLYKMSLSGVYWALIGLALGFLGEHGYLERRRRTRRV